jgi:hypothetical protein
VYLMGEGQYDRHYGLRLDGPVVEVFEEDPYNHCYSFLYTGTGRQLSVFLLIPPDHGRTSTHPSFNPPMQVTVRTLSQADEVEISRRKEQQQREDEKEIRRYEMEIAIRRQEEEARQREAAEIKQKELSRRALELAVAAHVDSNFLDPEYQQHFAAKHTSEILRTLSHRWRREYLEIMQNERLYTHLQAEHPLVLQWLEARVAVTRLAQRLAVAPRQLTPEEWTMRIERYRQRLLTRKRVKVEDYKADVMQDLELLQEFVADLDSYPLDEDERERLIQEFRERLLDGEEENSNGFRQL